MWLVKQQYNPFTKGGEHDLFDHFFSDVFQDYLPSKQSYSSFHVTERDKDILVEAALPGFTKKDVQIEFKDGYLTVLAEKKEAEKTALTDAQLKRQMYVGDVNFAKAKATLKDGVLTVELPKVAEVQAKRLEIK